MFRNRLQAPGLNRDFVSQFMQLKFIAPLMPTLVEKPPEGGNWIHDVKFDGYRSQMVIDENGTRIYTSNGHDWAAKYRDPVKEAAKLGAQSGRRDHRSERGRPVRLWRVAKGDHSPPA